MGIKKTHLTGVETGFGLLPMQQLRQAALKESDKREKKDIFLL